MLSKREWWGLWSTHSLVGQSVSRCLKLGTGQTKPHLGLPADGPCTDPGSRSLLVQCETWWPIFLGRGSYLVTMCKVWRSLLSVAGTFLDKELIMRATVWAWWLLWATPWWSDPTSWDCLYPRTQGPCSSESFPPLVVVVWCSVKVEALIWLSLPPSPQGYIPMLQFWVHTERGMAQVMTHLSLWDWGRVILDPHLIPLP